MRKKVRGKATRGHLATALRRTRALDAGKGENPYVLNRRLSQAPFENSLVRQLKSFLRVKKGRISVLDKGAGTGRMLAEVKGIAPERIDATALSASKTVGKRNAASFERVFLGSSVNTRFGKRFDVIYDCFGEDYHLPKQLIGESLKSSVSSLKKGGVLFSVISLTPNPTNSSFSIEGGKRFLRDFKRKNPGLKVSVRYKFKRFSFFEYVDMVLSIRKP